MVVSIQYEEPSLARLLSSPRQTRPLAIVVQRSRMNSGGWKPELMMR